MYSSLTFQTLAANGNPIQTFNTYKDLYLVPTSRPVIAPPSVKTHYVEIPGANGAIDLTESLSSNPMYGNSTGSIEFAVYSDVMPWFLLYSRIISYIHGKRAYMVMEDFPTAAYEGRWEFGDWKTSAMNLPTVTLNYNVLPFTTHINNIPGLPEAISGTWR